MLAVNIYLFILIELSVGWVGLIECMLAVYFQFNFGQELIGAPASPVATNANYAEEIPIEVINGPKSIFITSTGAYETDSMQPRRTPFDARVNDDLYKFLESVSENNVRHPERITMERRPPRRMEITGMDDKGGALPLVFDNNSDDIIPLPFLENQMGIPQPQPALDILDVDSQPNFVGNFQPVSLPECTDCLYNQEIRNRPPFPIYNYNLNSDFDRENGMIARETLQVNDRTGIEGGFIINNQPIIWE